MRRALQFYSSVCAMLCAQLEAAHAVETPEGEESEPGSGGGAAQAFRATPEWYVEDIAEFMLFAIQ